MFKPEKIKKKVEEIKKANNIDGLTNRDMFLWLVHENSKIIDNISRIQGCINDNENAIVENRIDIAWLKRNYWKVSVGIFSAIGLLALSQILM